MLMPSDSVSVAKTTFSSPAAKHSSTVSRKTGTRPAWCAATPALEPLEPFVVAQDPQVFVARAARPGARRSGGWRRARGASVRRTPSRTTWRTASSQAARLKMKTMAGSMSRRRARRRSRCAAAGGRAAAGPRPRACQCGRGRPAARGARPGRCAGPRRPAGRCRAEREQQRLVVLASVDGEVVAQHDRPVPLHDHGGVARAPSAASRRARWRC